MTNLLVGPVQAEPGCVQGPARETRLRRSKTAAGAAMPRQREALAWRIDPESVEGEPETQTEPCRHAKGNDALRPGCGDVPRRADDRLARYARTASRHVRDHARRTRTALR